MVFCKSKWARRLNADKENIMPYKRVGKNVMHKKSGRWKIKQRCTSASNAAVVVYKLRQREK